MPGFILTGVLPMAALTISMTPGTCAPPSMWPSSSWPKVVAVAPAGTPVSGQPEGSDKRARLRLEILHRDTIRHFVEQLTARDGGKCGHLAGWQGASLRSRVLLLKDRRVGVGQQ